MRRDPGPADVLLVAGEASGDLHGSTLARALGTLAPGIGLAGMGGARMAAEGVHLLARIEGVTVVGVTEALGRLPALWRTLRQLERRLREAPPRVLVVIDFPEFNLRLARRARALRVPVVYFVPPQLWAWRRGRVRAMARDVNRVLAVFPFEVPLYQEAGVPVEFVGHPILDVLPILDRAQARRELTADGAPLVGLLPGSRTEEVRRHLPVLLGAAARIARRLPGARFAVPLAPTTSPDEVGPAVEAAAAAGVAVRVVTGATYSVMAAADLLVLSSGTATLEAACFGTPMVVIYRLSRTSHVLARALVRGVSYISLPNIIADRGVVPELIQGQATPARVAAAALRLLEDEAAHAAQRVALGEVRARLGEGGAGLRAARAVLREGGAMMVPTEPTPSPPPTSPTSPTSHGPTAVPRPRRRRLREAGTLALGVGLGRGAVRLLGRSLRLREVNREAAERLWTTGGPAIYAVWHGRILMLPYLYGHRRRVHVLASRSRDGELLSRFVAGFGVNVVRGSSSRGGGAALLGLARLLREGAEVLVVPDGPRGPRYVAQSGAVLLAKLSGAPILPVAFSASPRTILGSWDAFMVPHPFARAAVVFGEPWHVAADSDKDALEQARQRLEVTLRQLTLDADRVVDGRHVRDL